MKEKVMHKFELKCKTHQTGLIAQQSSRIATDNKQWRRVYNNTRKKKIYIYTHDQHPSASTLIRTVHYTNLAHIDRHYGSILIANFPDDADRLPEPGATNFLLPDGKSTTIPDLYN